MKSAPSNTTLCPSCGGSSYFIGSIPPTDIFAGRILLEPLNGGSLYRCKVCQLGFRWPRLSKTELDLLYEDGSDHAWSSSVHLRRDWSVAHKWITSTLSKGDSILDIGCFDGGALESLVGNYKCFGVEIHPKARLLAEQKGISLIGSDFSDLKGNFGFITAFDVIEHVEDPAIFLRKCLNALRPGGCLLISTGNFDSFTFRMMGSRYWYCTIAEHISFVSPRWFLKHFSEMGCKCEKLITFAHDEASIGRRIKEIFMNALYWIHPSIIGALRRFGLGKKNIAKHPILAETPPGWVSASDHFMVLLRKL